MGVLFYVSGTFPRWYFWELMGRPFWDAWVLVDMALTTLLAAVFFEVTLRRLRHRSRLLCVYPMAALIIPSLLITIAVASVFVSEPQANGVAAIALWGFYGFPVLLCLVPYAATFGLIVYLAAEPRMKGDG
jgi:ABC-type xylose transport system permease subunit